MEFRLLGGVEAWSDAGPVVLGPARQRAVLAALLMDANRPVRVEQLVYRVWGDGPPRRARETLYGYVSRLRRLLPGAIARGPGGYVLTADEPKVDVHRFHRLLGPARQADDRAAVALFQEALALWRGEPFPGADTPWFNAARDTLRSVRWAAELDCADVRLRLGEHAALLSLLAERGAARPLDERLAAQYMLALYRCGRQADALAHYRRLRGLLAGELGIDPGEKARRLHEAILRGDTELSAPAAGAGPGGGAGAGTTQRARVAGNHLPRDLADFTGREREIGRLAACADEGAAVLAVDGMAGVGKTSLTVHAGHLLAGRFPDGQLFVDLQGHSEGKPPLAPAQALEVLLGQLGIAAATGAEARWRAETAGLRLLVVLDNAADEAQVAPLLPAGPGLTIVTSRARLLGLDAGRPLSLAVLAEEAATALLAGIVGIDRAAAEPEAVSRIVRLCAGLPLALRLSGARLAHRTAWPVGYLAARLSEAQRLLPELSFAGRGVALAFRMSYGQLPPGDQRVFQALGQHPGADADVAVVAVMAGLPVRDADDALQRLVDAHLAEEPVPGRYRQHDLLRHYARGLSGDGATVERMLGHYLTAVTECAVLGGAGRAADAGTHRTRRWLAAEKANVLAATRYAASQGRDEYAWRLAVMLWRSLARDPASDSVASLEQGLSAAREAADGGEALLSTLLALAHWSAGRSRLARDHLAAAATLYDDPESRAHVLALLGLVHLSHGAHTAAEEHAERAFAALGKLGSLSPLGLDAKIITYWTRGVVRGVRGEDESALAYLRAAHAGCGELGNQISPDDHVLTALARCLLALGGHEEARGHLERARDVRRRIGDRTGEGEVLVLLGMARLAQGHPDDAAATQRSALRMLAGDDRLQAYARIELGRTLAASGQPGAAVEEYGRALELAARGGHLHEEAHAHHELARALTAVDPPAAEGHHRAAAEIFTRLGVRSRMPLPHLRPAGW
ncbi:AfsR/SARP family transcriptional regulator [Streptomyces paludis]|uniref:Transcriptional regulator, SARP family protein n=1 Tax=Streptomyces paludis TaxID=2282738 RepID=A0A345HYN9_9ACTN|nr:BTAD domain-containing putative transcriptional regulator [Streptomyces paludis]AXG81813.1 transcriptional regulator, SARP family protein [Streptomyces paludis]